VKKINNIIFIDNDEATNAYHKLICDRIGCGNTVNFFINAWSALTHLQKIESIYDFPDLIFVDICMPEVSGHDFVTIVHEMPSFNHERTIIANLTASVDINDLIKSDANEVEHYYFKPIKELELIQLIDKNF